MNVPKTVNRSLLRQVIEIEIEIVYFYSHHMKLTKSYFLINMTDPPKKAP